MISKEIEELIKKIPNRYELVLLAAKKASELKAKGSDEKEGVKVTSIALKELIEGKVNLEEERKKLS
jgi:DNA-directed RNA polymerase omega subunit